jgi:hypothetical protein
MSPLRHLHRRPRPENKPEQPRPFPTASTFIAIALALIALWLVAGGLPKLMGWPEPSHSIEAGASR